MFNTAGIMLCDFGIHTGCDKPFCKKAMLFINLLGKL